MYQIVSPSNSVKYRFKFVLAFVTADVLEIRHEFGPT